jgi:F-type H+-transporting ATPase subunit delta
MAKKAGKLANRYAKALLGAAVDETKDPARLLALAESFQALSQLWKEQPEFRSCLQNPIFKMKSRTDALNGVTDWAGSDPLLKRFAQILLERGRIGIISEVSERFSEFADDFAGIVSVRIKSAKALELSEVQEIESDLSAKISGKPQFSWSVEPSLLGGLVIEYAGKVLDGSLTGRLDRIERALMN